MAYVLKIKYKDTLRRLSFQSKPRVEDLSFVRLETSIRDLFKLPPEAQIALTYTDEDDDVVTMASDQDLVDALIMQSLSPLRLDVSLVEAKTPEFSDAPSSNIESVETGDAASLKLALRGLSSESMKQVLSSCEPLLKGAAESPRRLAELVESLETIVKTVTSQISSAVKKVEAGSRPVLVDAFSSSVGPSRMSLADIIPKDACKFTAGGDQTTREFSVTDLPIPVACIPAVRREAPLSVVKSEASNGEPDNVNRFFHHGVQCDGCAMIPIAGPRFKSTKIHDFDLCLACMKRSGNIGDYTRIERPLFRPRHLNAPLSSRVRCPTIGPNFPGGRPVNMRAPYCARPERIPVHQLNGYGGKLDARFVQDVTVMDGTELTPGTRFTKIWRLRNSGTLPWAPQTKLVHVGGDELGSVFAAPLHLPDHGLVPEAEIEASVNLVAPDKPGRYVSHWRLASPSGPKFGHRVWVLIQVISPESEMAVGHIDTDVESCADPMDTTPVVTAPHLPLVAPESRIATLVDPEGQLSSVPAASCDNTPVFSVPLSVMAPESRDNVSVPDVSGGAPGSRAAFVAASHQAALDRSSGPAVISRAAFVKASHEAFAKQEADIRYSVIPPKQEAEIRYPTVDVSNTSDTIEGPFSFLTVSDKVSDVKKENLAGVKEEVIPEKVVLDDVVAVESSDLGGGFSMVEMPSNTSSRMNSAPVSPRVMSISPAVEPTSVTENLAGEVSEAMVASPEGLSVKLEAMGFADRKLNMELLLKNKLDLRRTLEDLFAAAEWDPLLEELEEMGFYDTDMNRRLMFKNNGSVKRVVKELVQIYKQPSVKGSQSVE